MTDVLILGGYGNFGKRIARALIAKGIGVTIAGRNTEKCAALKAELNSELIETATFDVTKDLRGELSRIAPKVVINTCGPFQGADHNAAQACIDNKSHYIDLADGREFVCSITNLNAAALARNIAVISGASTVPALSSAVLEHFKSKFKTIETLKYGISPGQKAERGIATTKGILTYVGKPLKPFMGHEKAFGWQDAYHQKYPEIGTRFMANCDIPDLDLLPEKYGLKSIQFSAGLELGFMHFGLWGLSYLVRLGLPLGLPTHTKLLFDVANWFDIFGTDDGGMHVIMRGLDKSGAPHKISWFILAKNGDGPQIPTVPAILLTQKLLNGSFVFRGAAPCVAMVSLREYLTELKQFSINTYIE